MKIALLSPTGAMHRFSGSFKRSLHYAPLTLTTLAALVPMELEAQICIYDESVEKIPHELDVDLIAMTVITGTSMRAYKYADYFRSKGITVVMGGVHPSLMPDEAAEHADAIMVGLGDDSWPELLRDFAQGAMKKVYHEKENLTLTGRPHPRRDLLKAEHYFTMNTIEAVRGCSLPCTFCAYPAAFGRKIIKRPIAEVIFEIEQMPGKVVLFPDVNLIADREYAIQLFTAMIPLKKWWFGLVTSNVGIDDTLIQLFYKSGCKGLLIGFESVTQSAQAYINKGVNHVGSYDLLVKKLHHVGITINGCFAFGGDDENKDVFKRTVEEVIRLKIDLPRYSILTPFPGTELYREMEAQNRITERHWAMYDVEHCVFEPKNMTAEDLVEGIEWAWRETYTNGNILKRLSYWNSFFLASVPTNLAYRHYADKFKLFTKEVMTDDSDIPSPLQVGS